MIVGFALPKKLMDIVSLEYKTSKGPFVEGKCRLNKIRLALKKKRSRLTIHASSHSIIKRNRHDHDRIEKKKENDSAIKGMTTMWRYGKCKERDF